MLCWGGGVVKGVKATANVSCRYKTMEVTSGQRRRVDRGGLEVDIGDAVADLEGGGAGVPLFFPHQFNCLKKKLRPKSVNSKKLRSPFFFKSCIRHCNVVSSGEKLITIVI